MPSRPPIKRALGAVAIAASFLTLAMPAPARSAEPGPLPGYQPAFVTEREPGVWEDCIWASASMLLDKWTSGLTTVDRERLRIVSGDSSGGSNLADVQRAFARLGFRLPTSPNGGETITWPKLLARLGSGGGAILLGDYGRLPEHYGRWDRTFWTQVEDKDDHAVYLDRYDPRTGRVLVMDPLAPKGWAGEWIPVWALKQYAWRTAGGSLWTAMTPAALVASLVGVALGEATATFDASALHVSWPIERTPKGWTYTGSSVTTQFMTITEVGPEETVLRALTASEAPHPSAAPSSFVAAGSFTTTIPLPSEPGIYRVTVAVADPRFGQQVATAGPFSLYLPGPRAASYVLPARVSVAAGALAGFSVTVANVGTESWAGPPLVAWAPELQRPLNTRLTGTWVRGPRAAAEDRVLRAPVPVDLGLLDLEPGQVRSVSAFVRAPADPGSWRLIVDIVDDHGGSLALAGSAPGVITIEVVASGQGPSAE